MHGLKNFHEFSVNSLAPLSICGTVAILGARTQPLLSISARKALLAGRSLLAVGSLGASPRRRRGASESPPPMPPQHPERRLGRKVGAILRDGGWRLRERLTDYLPDPDQEIRRSKHRCLATRQEVLLWKSCSARPVFLRKLT